MCHTSLRPLRSMSFIVFFVLAISVLLKGHQLGCVACALLVGQLQISGHNMPSSLDLSVLICVEALNCHHPIEAICGQR